MKHIFYSKNIAILFGIGALQNFLLLMPVITLFFQSHWLSLTEIMILQVVYSLFIVVLEIPSGYIADIFKRKYSLNIGLFLSCISPLIFILLPWFWWFLVWELILGIWVAFVSWADSAYLYDELVLLKKEKKYQKIEWSYMSVWNFSESAAAFISGFIVVLWFVYLLYWLFAVFFIAFILSLFLTEHSRNAQRGEKLKMKDVLNFIMSKKNTVKSYIAFAAILWTSTLTFLWLAQPLWKQEWLDIQYFGIVWWVLNTLVWVAAMFAYKLETKLSLRQIILLFWLWSFVFYILLYFTKNIYLILIISSFFWIFRWINWPIIKDYINKQTSSKMRATVMSVKSLAFRLIFSIISPFVWYLADIYTLHISLLLSGLIFAILWGVSMITILFIKD